ncbi:MAG: methionyl aminopeptidase [Actinomycetota bacterium]|jgi:methionyl aminopeptidase|nr:methionyl aminopeptidase [Actinomycetota bacterium]
MNLVKTAPEIAIMRKAGRVVAEMLDACQAAAKPGVTTLDLDHVARGVLEKRNAKSNFLNYHGFPGVICTSPNDVIVHGIPGKYVLQEGDIVSIDAGAIIDGWHGDAARTVPVGEISNEAKRLIEITERALWAGIDQMKNGNRLFDIGGAVQEVAEGAGYSVVREYVGHGIGRAMHEQPQIPNYRPVDRSRNMKIRSGNVFAVEPMVNIGSPKTELNADGWTVVTADGLLSAHFEHSIAVTDDGPEVLTVL